MINHHAFEEKVYSEVRREVCQDQNGTYYQPSLPKQTSFNRGVLHILPIFLLGGAIKLSSDLGSYLHFTFYLFFE
jgi:hypothetical protein